MMNFDDNDTATGLFVPSSYFLVAGRGDSTSSLIAFDLALLSVGIGNVNLIKLSSILAPGLKNYRPSKIAPGSFVGAAYATFSSSGSKVQMAAAVAIAHSTDPSRESVIMEYAGQFSAKEAERIVTEMATKALESRKLQTRSVEIASIEHVSVDVGCVFAAVIQV